MMDLREHPLGSPPRQRRPQLEDPLGLLLTVETTAVRRGLVDPANQRGLVLIGQPRPGRSGIVVNEQVDHAHDSPGHTPTLQVPWP